MKCDICGSESSKMSGVMGVGWCCSDECVAKGRAQVKAQEDELLSEDVGVMPEQLETGDFERWAHKFALHYLRAITPADRAYLAEENPMMLLPNQMSLHLKELILRHVPREYMHEEKVRGHGRIFHDSTYRFVKPVPCEVIVAAAKKAEVIK